MARYHFNPETGEPGYCRAKPGGCPFLAQGARHFDSKEAARRGYEEFQEKGFQSLTAQLMVTRARLQREIIRIFTNPELKKSEDELLKSLVNERNSIERAIAESSRNFSNPAPALNEKPQQVIYEEVADDRGDIIIGISNVEEELAKKAPETAAALVNVSEQWLSRLSTEEAQAVWAYAGNAESANGNGEILSQAVLKAPRMKPTKVYSGLGVYVTKDVLSQYKSGRINLAYPISTSINPAQVNGFMGKFENHVQQKAVALEIDTTVGGSMAAASHALHEFEVLLPAGEYEVISVRENVEFRWGEDRAGRTAELLIKVRRVD